MVSVTAQAQTEVTGSIYQDGKYQNWKQFNTMSLKGTASSLWRFMTDKSKQASPDQAIPMVDLSGAAIEAASGDDVALYRLGHSSILLDLAGEYWLLDPVFADRASPVQWMGPKRFHQAPVELEDLPPIKGVLISHDHYDHLDKQTMRYLADKVEHFVVPLGVDGHLKKWGVDAERIQALDWWQSVELDGLTLTATPTQHFSGRGLTDGNQTLWASWVIEHEAAKIYFSGDSGYFEGFKQIGEKFGPFDLTLMENGAYDKDWPEVHMSPEETMQAQLDLGGKAMLPIHNGTFDLALHAWFEPLERLHELSLENNVSMITPLMGQRLSLEHLDSTWAWWQEMAEEVQQAGLGEPETNPI